MENEKLVPNDAEKLQASQQAAVQDGAENLDQKVSADCCSSEPAAPKTEEKITSEEPLQETESQESLSVQGDEEDTPEKTVRPQVTVTQEMLDVSSRTLATMFDYLGLDAAVK